MTVCQRGSGAGRVKRSRLVVGAKEAADDHAALCSCDGGRLDPQPVSDALTHISALVGADSTDL